MFSYVNIDANIQSIHDPKTRPKTTDLINLFNNQYLFIYYLKFITPHSVHTYSFSAWLLLKAYSPNSLDKNRNQSLKKMEYIQISVSCWKFDLTPPDYKTRIVRSKLSFKEKSKQQQNYLVMNTHLASYLNAVSTKVEMRERWGQIARTIVQNSIRPKYFRHLWFRSRSPKLIEWNWSKFEY